MAESKPVVIAALVANVAIAVVKFIGFLLTGSASMLSETYHSASDTGNQIFLLFGIRYSKKQPDRDHPFGYGKAQFFYSFLVSILLFGIAGWESLREGYTKLMHGASHEAAGAIHIFGLTFDPHLPFPPIYVNYVVLIAAILFESYSFKKAYTELGNQIEEHDWSGYVEAFRKTSDVTTLTSFTEDSIAVIGAGLALLGNFLKHATGNEFYDAGAAFLIGLLLMTLAVALAWENKRLLLGESLPLDEEQQLHDLVASYEGVTDIKEFRTVYFGPERVLVTAHVDFEDDLDAPAIDHLIDNIESAMYDSNIGVWDVIIEPEEIAA